MATINTGSSGPIQDGQIVYATHVLPIITALSGIDPTDIIIGGDLTLNGGSGHKLDVTSTTFTASLGKFTNTVSASGDIFVGNKLTAASGVFTAITSSIITASLVSASANISAPVGTFANNIQFTNLGVIISGSGNVSILQHILTQSSTVGNGLIFGGSQFRDYLIQGAASPRIGIGPSNIISTASLASGSFITTLPTFTQTPATLLITSSDAYVMKIATNAVTRSFSISSSGFVGINTWTPREALDIQSGNAAIKNPTTTSGSILYIENAAGRILDVTNYVTNSIFTVQNLSGLPILDVGTNSAGSSYTAVTGNGLGITPALSSSFNLISGSMTLTFTSGSTVSPGVNDLVVVATDTVTLPTAATAGVGRYYIIRNANPLGGSSIAVGAGASTVSGITSLGPTSASQYISDGVGIWYSL
jgi:hypothetical protein